jgi:hypothetical protein
MKYLCPCSLILFLLNRFASLNVSSFYFFVCQALSIRPDILSPRSMVELQKLCDKVPSYDSKIAFATMERELGRPVDEIFSFITDEPVAAASLGQVVCVTACRVQRLHLLPISYSFYQPFCLTLCHIVSSYPTFHWRDRSRQSPTAQSVGNSLT